MNEPEQRKFGDVIRDARLALRPPLSLRKFAEKIGIAAAYLSKVESNQDRPPAADKVEKMAEILGLDPIELLQLAKRVPTEFVKAFEEDPRAPEFMRVGMRSGLSPTQLEKLIQENQAKILKEGGKNGIQHE